MNRSRMVVDRIEFGQLFRFPMILRGVTQAMQPPRLVVGLLIVVAIMAVGKAWDGWVDTPTISPQGLLAPERSADQIADAQQNLRAIVAQLPDKDKKQFGERQLDAREVADAYERYYRYQRMSRVRSEVPAITLQAEDREFFRTMERIDEVRPRGVFEATINQVNASFRQVVLGVVTLEPMQIGRAFADVFVRTPVALWSAKPWFCSLFGLYAAIVLALGGGALSRMAACEYAGRERLRVNDAIDFALAGAIRLVFTPLLPLIIVGFLGLVLMAFGVVGFLPYADVLGGALYGPMMLIGFIIAFVLLCFAGGFIMVIPAVATENCGPAHAHERAFAYLLARPLHLLGYVVVALIGLAIGYFVVSLFIVATMNVTSTFVGAFPSNSALSVSGGFEIFNLEPRGPGEIHADWHSSTAAWFISFWQTLLVSFVAAYVLSYCMTCSTAIYLLMRRLVDHQDMSEIWRAGLVPGTLAPIPTPLAGTADEDEPARTSRSESMMRGLVRKAAKAGFGRGGEAERPTSPVDEKKDEPKKDAEPAATPTEDAAPKTELGPELLSKKEQKLAEAVVEDEPTPDDDKDSSDDSADDSDEEDAGEGDEQLDDDDKGDAAKKKGSNKKKSGQSRRKGGKKKRNKKKGDDDSGNE